MVDLDWQPIMDSVEGSFSVELPTQWSHDVRLLRFGTEQRRVVQSAAPDDSVRLFGHDPELPTCFEPASGMFVQPPLQQLATYVSADRFLADYVQRRFGEAPGLRFDGLRPERELADAIMRRGVEQGISTVATSASARLGFTENGRKVQVLLLGSTTSIGAFWMPDVAGVFCTGDPEEYRDLLLRVLMSERTNPQWRMIQNQNFANTMAANQQQSDAMLGMMQRGHEQRMGNIAQAGAANTQLHQQRMDTSAAGHAAYLDRLNQPAATSQVPGLDEQHSFINAIREEETVRTASGEDVQVDAGADRYFVDESNRRWVGTVGAADEQDLRAAGIDPDDFQEGQVRR